MKTTLAFLLLLSLNKILTSSSNLLIIQSYGYYSHTKVQHSLFLNLLENGHNLTIFTPRIMDYSGHKNVTQFHFYEHYWEANNSTIDAILQFIITNGGLLFFNNLAYIYEVMKANLKNSEFRKLFLEPENHKFDLIILETDLYISEILADIYDCPIVKLAACEMVIFQHEMFGNLANPAVHSSVFLQPRVHGQLSFFDRVLSFLLYLVKYVYSYGLEFFVNDLLQDEFLGKLRLPAGYEVSKKRLQMRFIFMNRMTTSVRPIVPSYHHIGFYHLQPPKPLNLELQSFIDSSTNGVILLSIGSELSFTEHHQQIFLNAFKALKFDIIWKVNPADLQKFKIPKNILTSNWLPIADILAHPNVKALITHGGARTIEEAIDREVPTIFIPMVCDQHFNVKILAENGVGIRLDVDLLSEETVVDAVHVILKDEYKENVKKFRQFVYDQLMSSQEVSMENIEYILKYKDAFHFQLYAGRNIGLAVRYFFDIYAVILLLIWALFKCWKILRNILRFLSNLLSLL